MPFLRGPTNFINDVLYSNCQRPFYIYVLTAIPCLIEAVIMLRLFDFDDLVRARGQYLARGGGTPPRGLRHGVRRRGKQLPRSQPHRGYRQGLKHLLALTQPLEHIGFALLLIGVVDRFYANWMMYLDDADACLSPSFYGPLIRRQDDGVAHPNASGNTVQLPQLISDPAGWGSSNISATLPIGRYKAVLGVTIVGPGGGARYRVALRVTGVIGSGEFEGEEQYCGPGQHCDLMADADIFAPFVTGAHVSWVIKGPGVPVGLEVVKADVYIQRSQTASDLI